VSDRYERLPVFQAGRPVRHAVVRPILYEENCDHATHTVSEAKRATRPASATAA
jgi:hypothetical protein